MSIVIVLYWFGKFAFLHTLGKPKQNISIIVLTLAADMYIVHTCLILPPTSDTDSLPFVVVKYVFLFHYFKQKKCKHPISCTVAAEEFRDVVFRKFLLCIQIQMADIQFSSVSDLFALNALDVIEIDECVTLGVWQFHII